MREPLQSIGVLILATALASCAAPVAAPPRAAAPPPPVQAVAPPPLPAPAVDRGERWTGLSLEVLTEEVARARNLSRAEGLYVLAVENGSPAARAGIRPADVVLLAGGTYLGAIETLAQVLARARLGSVVEMGIRRGGDLVAVRLPVEESPSGRLMVVIQPPVRGLTGIAADGGTLWAYGPVPGGADRGIVPIQLPGSGAPAVGPRPVASPIAERVIAADSERVYLGWAGSELYVDAYEVASGRVIRLPVRGAEGLANRCQPRGLARVLGEIWMACQRPEGPAVVRIDLASGQARIDPLPPTYWSGLAFDGEAVLWLCCQSGGRVSLARTPLTSTLASPGATRVFPLPAPVTSLAADPGAVYLLAASGIYQHKPWR